MSSSLNATARVQTQAARNVNEAISFLNVADGATSALKDILFRVRELSTQSSNGTFSNAQRQSIDKESQALQGEYQRILESTSYNGIRVFGSGDIVAQAGVGTDAALVVNISSVLSTTKGDGTFQAKQAFSTGILPCAIAVADFDGDGKSDLVTADKMDSTASILVGNGNGTFQAKRSFQTGTWPESLAVTDFNGDGKSDLATGDRSSNTLSVLLGNGNGTFQVRRSFSTGTDPMGVTVADVNGDGKTDLASADYNSYAGNTVSVLLGNGDGTFQVRTFVPTGTVPATVAFADLNGDGKGDLVDADVADGTASVLFGNGDGTFQARHPFATGGGTVRCAAADLNGDGISDLVSADSNDNTVSVLLGNGTGTFQARRSYATGTNPGPLAVVDFNGDGKTDLLTGDSGGNTTSVLLGNGDGTFQTKRSFITGGPTHSVAVGDFNSDGVKDIVTADYSSNTASLLLGNGTTVYGLQPIVGVNLVTQDYALSAQSQIDSYLDNVNKVSGAIGTALSRFQIAAHVASSVADVSQAAEARITDADVADNTAALVRTQILQQASSAILAQANQQPALALTLLGRSVHRPCRRDLSGSPLGLRSVSLPPALQISDAAT